MRRLRHAGRWGVACAVLAVALAGCGAPATGTGQRNAGAGGGAGAAAPQSGGAQSGAGGQSGAGQPGGQSGANMACQSAAKVTITEKAAPGRPDRYAFSPASITMQRGGLLSIQNRSDEMHALESVPDAGIVTTVLMKKERQFVQFPQAGTFTLHSADAAHRATLKVVVSGDTGCGPPRQSLAVTETKAGGADVYAFSPKTLRVAAGENVLVVNRSDETQTLRCTPDAGDNAFNTALARAESQIVALDQPGTYTCVTGKKARVTVTVTGM